MNNRYIIKLMNKIIIYTTPTCTYCRMAKAFFRVRGINFEEKNVHYDKEAKVEMIKKSGAMAVPVIDFDGEIIVGFHRNKLLELLGEETYR